MMVTSIFFFGHFFSSPIENKLNLYPNRFFFSSANASNMDQSNILSSGEGSTEGRIGLNACMQINKYLLQSTHFGDVIRNVNGAVNHCAIQMKCSFIKILDTWNFAFMVIEVKEMFFRWCRVRKSSHFCNHQKLQKILGFLHS